MYLWKISKVYLFASALSFETLQDCGSIDAVAVKEGKKQW
jgi:hypothetical protein